jgi:NADH-quinone oxidoreductase subunit L
MTNPFGVLPIILLLIPLVPFLGGAVVFFLKKDENISFRLLFPLGALSLLGSVIMDAASPWNGHPVNFVLFPDPFSEIPGPGISISWDPLSGILSIFILLVFLNILTFSRRTMSTEPYAGAFLSALSLATGSLLLLVTARHLLLIYLAWELVLLALILLLIHHRHRSLSAMGVISTWTMNQLGGGLLLSGFLLVGKMAGTFDLDTLFRRLDPQLGLLQGSPGELILACTLISCGLCIRSVQFPFHGWLLTTLDAPTPVSAFMHAGIVNAGGFLLTRLAPLFNTTPIVLDGLFLVGATTAVAGSAMMLIQVRVKNTLVYSTIGQMGYMIAECGLGVFPAAIFHMIAHGIFKGTLFLGSGSIIHEIRVNEHEPKGVVRKLFGRHHKVGILLLGMIVIVPLGWLWYHMIRGGLFLPQNGAFILIMFGVATAIQTVLSLTRSRHLLTPKSLGIMAGALITLVGLYWGSIHLFDQMLEVVVGKPSPEEVDNRLRFLVPATFTTMAYILFLGGGLLMREGKSSPAVSPALLNKIHGLLGRDLGVSTFARRLITEPLMAIARTIRSLTIKPGDLSVRDREL